MCPKWLSPRFVRGAAATAWGAGALGSALLFGAAPTAHAAPPSPVTRVALAGPHGGANLPASPAHFVPVRGGHGWGGHGHGWGGHGGWHRSGWGHGWGHRRWWRWWW